MQDTDWLRGSQKAIQRHTLCSFLVHRSIAIGVKSRIRLKISEYCEGVPSDSSNESVSYSVMSDVL